MIGWIVAAFFGAALVRVFFYFAEAENDRLFWRQCYITAMAAHGFKVERPPESRRDRIARKLAALAVSTDNRNERLLALALANEIARYRGGHR